MDTPAPRGRQVAVALADGGRAGRPAHGDHQCAAHRLRPAVGAVACARCADRRRRAGVAVEQVGAALGQRLPDGFVITEAADTEAAERLIRDREAYGAIDVSSGTPQVVTASAAGASVAQTLQASATALSQAQGTSTAVPIRDPVTLPADDPRGAGPAAGALPLVMGGLMAALLLTGLVRGTARRVIGAFASATTGGLAVAAVLQFWLGSLGGSCSASTGAVALTIAAPSLSILGLESLLGYAGLGLGAATIA